MTHSLKICSGVCLVILAPIFSRADVITVFAAASLTDALREIASNYQKDSGDKIMFNFAASSTLERQIEESAPADIFFSADEAKMDALQKKQLIDASTRRSRLGNSLVVVVTAESALRINTASDLTNAFRIALADPKIVPAGIYAKVWLTRQRLWPALEPKVVPTENVRAALAAVESGNVDAGVVYKTDAAISHHTKIAFEVPANETAKISYPMALLSDSKHEDAAKRFLDYLAAEQAGLVFKRFGFIVLK